MLTGQLQACKNKAKSCINSKQLIYPERLVFAGKSQTLALLYGPCYRSVNTAWSQFEI